MSEAADTRTLIYRELAHVEILQAEADEQFARDQASRDPEQLMAFGATSTVGLALSATLIGLTMLLFMFSVFFEAVALAVLYLPVLFLVVCMTVVSRLAIQLKSPVARSYASLVCTTGAFVGLVLALVPYVDACFRLVYRHSVGSRSYAERFGDLGRSMSSLPVNVSNVESAGLVARNVRSLVDESIMEDVTWGLASLVFAFAAIVFAQAIAIRPPDSRPPSKLFM
jgi:uncharacterized membrane protein YhdT